MSFHVKMNITTTINHIRVKTNVKNHVARLYCQVKYNSNKCLKPGTPGQAEYGDLPQ